MPLSGRERRYTTALVTLEEIMPRKGHFKLFSKKTYSLRSKSHDLDSHGTEVIQPQNATQSVTGFELSSREQRQLKSSKKTRMFIKRAVAFERVLNHLKSKLIGDTNEDEVTQDQTEMEGHVNYGMEDDETDKEGKLRVTRRQPLTKLECSWFKRRSGKYEGGLSEE